MRHGVAVLWTAAAVLLASASGASAQSGQNPSFNLVNRAASPIRELYVTPAGDARWGRNRLEGITIAAGAAFPVRRRLDGNCVFDIRAVFADGRTEDRRGIDTCNTDDVAVGQAAASRAKPADDPSFTLINRSPQPVVELFATPAGLGNWGENRLADSMLAPGTDRLIRIPRQGTCLFDLRLVLADHSAKERHKTNLCQVTSLPVP